MGTTENTAALYLRKSSMDDQSGDNRSITDQRHDLERLAAYGLNNGGSNLLRSCLSSKVGSVWTL